MASETATEVMENINAENLVVGRSIKTKILEKINSGSYGEIHHGIFMNTGEKVAVKIEKMKCPNPQLLSEGNIMRHLEGGPGIPKVFWFGGYEPHFNCMVLDLLGPNLQELFAYCGHLFTLKTVFLIADQVLESLDFIHKQEYVHRDIKPDNFAIGFPGTSRENKIFLFDFGLSKKFKRKRYSVTSMSPTALTRPTVGTVRYMGLHTHDGCGDLPRDDLESLAYCLVYFLKGKLPWQGIRGCVNREEKLVKIKFTKASVTPESLCRDLPKVFADLVQTCRNSRSPYDLSVCASKWRRMLQAFAVEMCVAYDEKYDWLEKKIESGLDYPTSSINHGHLSS